MRRASIIGGTIVLAVGCAAVGAGSASQQETARAELRDAGGRRVGTATLTEVDNGVLVVAEVNGLPPGRHGFHFHEKGLCEGPKFESAGGHFNPLGRQHGPENPHGPHGGDMPNIVVLADGTGRAWTLNPYATLKEGERSLFRTGGTALMIHANADDYYTDPTGNAGDRIACGVITRR